MVCDWTTIPRRKCCSRAATGATTGAPSALPRSRQLILALREVGIQPPGADPFLALINTVPRADAAPGRGSLLDLQPGPWWPWPGRRPSNRPSPGDRAGAADRPTPGRRRGEDHGPPGRGRQLHRPDEASFDQAAGTPRPSIELGVTGRRRAGDHRPSRPEAVTAWLAFQDHHTGDPGHHRGRPPPPQHRTGRRPGLRRTTATGSTKAPASPPPSRPGLFDVGRRTSPSGWQRWITIAGSQPTSIWCRWPTSSRPPSGRLGATAVRVVVGRGRSTAGDALSGRPGPWPIGSLT